jgi:hypothetical protein
MLSRATWGKDMVDSKSEQEQQPSLWLDLKDIWSKGTLLASIIALPHLSVSAAVTLALQPIDPLKEVVFGTWPLVASATILIMMIIRRSFADMTDAEMFWAVAACLAVPYLIAYFSGAAGYADPRGETTKSWVQLLHPAHLFWLVVNIASYYFSAFGLIRTGLAIVCGGFLAWAFQIKLLPHVQRLTAKD